MLVPYLAHPFFVSLPVIGSNLYPQPPNLRPPVAVHEADPDKVSVRLQDIGKGKNGSPRWRPFTTWTVDLWSRLGGTVETKKAKKLLQATSYHSGASSPSRSSAGSTGSCASLLPNTCVLSFVRRTSRLTRRSLTQAFSATGGPRLHVGEPERRDAICP